MRWLLNLFRPSTGGKQESEPEEADAPKPKPGEYERLGEAMTSIRESLRTSGGAFAAGGAAVVAGLGYTQLHATFPVPADAPQAKVIGAVVLGALLTLAGTAYFSAQFFAAQRRIPMSTTEEVGLSDSEKELRKARFDEEAEAEDASSLNALELRAIRLGRIARRQSPGPLRELLEAEVKRIEDAIALAFRRTAGAILERRAHEVYFGNRTKRSVTAFILGVILLFGVADWSKGQRDLIDLRAKCADAQNKGAPDACDPVRADQDPSDSPSVAERTAVRQAESQTALIVSCLNGVVPAVKSEEKEVIAAAVALCAPATAGG